ncbi:MAG: hypothetical protein AABY44_09530 [Nitrospirota bacterium]
MEAKEIVKKLFPAIMGFILFFILTANSLSAQQVSNQSESSVKPSPDELEAMKKLEENPTPENIETLANIRYDYAVTLAKIADEKKDPDIYSLSVLYAESATLLSPDVGKYWSLLGDLYARMDGIPLAELLAEEALRRAIDIDPKDQSSRLLLSKLLYSQEYYSLSLDQLETVVKNDSKMAIPAVLFIMLNAYVLDYQHERGVIFFEELVKTHPQDDNPRFMLAILLNQQGERDEAIKELQKIMNRSGVYKENSQYAKRLIESWNNGGSKK